MKTFLTQYYHNGTWWTLKIKAEDFDDAERRCRRLNMQLLGEHKFTLYGPFGWAAGWLMDFFA